jgi:putative membrane-bound dehydrogenase-like protein
MVVSERHNQFEISMHQQLFYLMMITLFLPGCYSKIISEEERRLIDSLAMRQEYDKSPVVSPEESIKKMQVEEGFAVRLVAAEPLVKAPIAMTFDEKGRIWVVEMHGYMTDTIGSEEHLPTGRIVILEDENSDGVADKRKIFLDSLVLPRAIALVENGVLVAEPPHLWYIEINEDRAGNKQLVDDKYTEGGNAEHQANGLLRSIDNWIYNANSRKRYKKTGGNWLIDRTHFRGQWGITQDDFGRLFYNNNSQNLLGDYFLPSLGANNRNQLEMAGLNEKVVADNRVYPIRPTTGVNRAYRENALDARLRIKSVTAACGPVSYRGGLFGVGYNNNIFVAEPAANLLKRNIMQEKGYLLTGRQAYAGKEFLASTDERFRPVSLYNGPDGALYVVDMYRGIIEHKTYLTDYLKKEIRNRDLSAPLNCGRIYKIVPLNKQTKRINIPTDPFGLAQMLEDQNGWLRDKAQQLIIEKKYTQVVPLLRKYLTGDKPLTVIHALWTLEGLDALRSQEVLPLLHHPDFHIRAHALTVLPSVVTKYNYPQYLSSLRRMVTETDTLAAPYLAFLVHDIQRYNQATADDILMALIKRYPHNNYVADAVISNLQNREGAFLKQVSALYKDSSLAVQKRLTKVLVDISSINEKNTKLAESRFSKGAALFKSSCQSCHGPDGNGIKSLAPPLNRSEWVTGDKNKLASIVLFGLAGPVKVNGKLYKAPEINGDMPGIHANKEVSDQDIAQLLSYIRNAWTNKADEVNPSTVQVIRKRYNGRQKAFTADELNRQPVK